MVWLLFPCQGIVFPTRGFEDEYEDSGDVQPSTDNLPKLSRSQPTGSYEACIELWHVRDIILVA